MQPRTALITGAARGIGREVARRLAKAGYAVAVNDLRTDPLDELCEEIRKAGGEAEACSGDVADDDAVTSMIADISAKLAPPLVIVNNAALTEVSSPWTDISVAEWDRVLAVNLRSCFCVARAAYP